MNYFEFTKRFPDENSAIDFIVAGNTRMAMYVPSADVYTKRDIKTTI